MPTISPPPSISPWKRLPLFWQIQLAGWIGFAVLSMPLKQAVYGSLHAALLFTAYQLPLAILLTTGMRGFYLWAQPERRPFSMAVLMTLAAAALASALDACVSLPLNRILDIRQESEVAGLVLYVFRTALYIIWSLGYLLICALLRSREQAFVAAVADERHRFELLRYQLNPAFLAKSLATISRETNGNAREMTELLADYYRATLRQSDEGRPTLIGDEIALLKAYLGIEGFRRPEALRVRFDVDESLLNEPLPPVLLLPLAELVLKEGGGTPARPLEIVITVQRTDDGQVLLEVANSGRVGLNREARPFAMPGDVTDVRAALDRHYPGRHRFLLTEDSFAARATLLLPLASGAA
ncbi:MAG: histidine kinase [Undibacterium sp.]|nr:histidine kinase [Opitutaceae bacterium]